MAVSNERLMQSVTDKTKRNFLIKKNRKMIILIMKTVHSQYRQSEKLRNREQRTDIDRVFTNGTPMISACFLPKNCWAFAL